MKDLKSCPIYPETLVRYKQVANRNRVQCKNHNCVLWDKLIENCTMKSHIIKKLETSEKEKSPLESYLHFYKL